MNNEIKTNIEIWDKIYASGSSNLSYPNENLVRLIKGLYGKEVHGKKALDFGFGSGNNLKFLFEFGFDVYGFEVSSNAKSIAISKMPSEYNSENLIINDFFNLDISFDLIIAWQVLFYNTFNSIVKISKDLYDRLLPGGKFIFTVATSNDISFTSSYPISDSYERKINNDIPNQNDATIVVFPSEQDILSTFTFIGDIEIGYFETMLLGIVTSHWIICGKKK